MCLPDLIEAEKLRVMRTGSFSAVRALSRALDPRADEDGLQLGQLVLGEGSFGKVYKGGLGLS